MAERRMLSCKIICSDAYIEIPATARDLYVQFIMAADDDGFLNSPIRVMRTVCATQDDLDILIAKRFILRFPNGVIVIKHWRIHNQIRKDRYSPTQYQNEFNTLEIRDDGAYTEKEKEPMVDGLATTWQPTGNQTATQYRLGKDSIGKVSIERGDETGIGDAESPSPEKEKITCQQVVDLYHSICKSFSSVRSLSDTRKKAIKARLNTYSLNDFKAVFENAEASSFLKGANDRNWTATFDWMIKDQNMAKVLEGNYADKPQRNYGNGRKEIVPSWMNQGLSDLEKQAIARMMNSGQEEANDPAFKAEVEELQGMLKEKYGKGASQEQ